MRVSRGIAARLLHIDGAPIVVRAWQRRDGEVAFHASPAGGERRGRGGAGGRRLELAIARMRFALGADDDYREIYGAFRADPLLGRAIRRRRWHRPRRRPWAWEALAWVGHQAADRVVARGRDPAADGPAMGHERRSRRRDAARRPHPGADRRTCTRGARRNGPCAGSLPGADPGRPRGRRRRVDPADPSDDGRLLAIPEIGPWTIQCLGLYGRGEPDSLPAGDLGYIKLIGHLAGLGRRATVEEVEEFFAPYAPFRGLAGSFVLAAYHRTTARGRRCAWPPEGDTRSLLYGPRPGR